MEFPYMREREEEEDEEENGVNLLTRRNSKSHHQSISNISFTSSDTSVITTELSNSSFEYSSTVSSMENYYINSNNNTITNITNGEKPKFIEGRSVNNDQEAVEALSEADEKASFDENNKRENYSNVVHQNQDSNGTTARQKGVGVIEYSFSESNGGDKETDLGSNTDVGFRDVGSLLDESSNRVNVTSSEIYNTENTVRKFVVLNDQGEIVETSHSEDIEQEFEEYHVESVVKNQKTHDIICPNCKHCITDRVILKRRKRKTPEPDAEKSPPENQPSHDEPTPGHLDAISCFSCFSIFIPKGDGFLCWRFKPKQSVPLQPGSTPPEHTGPVQQPHKEGTGSRFPLWIMTCCQPDHTETPASEPGRKPLLTPEQPEAGIGDPGRKDELHSPPSHADPEGQAPPKSLSPIVPDPENQLPHTTEPPRTPNTSNSGQDFPLWIVTCCQPSSGRDKPEQSPKPGSEVPDDDITSPYDGLKSQFQGSNRPPSQSQGTPVQPEQDTLVHSEGGFPLWFLTCCQPSIHGKDSKLPVKSDETVVTVSSEHKTETKPENGTGVSHPRELSPTQINDAKSVPHTSKPPSISESWPPLSGPKDSIIRDDEIPSPSESEHQKPLKKDHIMDIPSEPRPPSSVTQPNDGPAPGVGAIPLPYPPEDRRPGVSGLDIIKAIVYGGLVECITSLSVITSAAGGDATTLNIVALGLANVAGGLVLLLHNLRVLIHEHTADRYEDQLGRRDHFLLHAVVAVISYLIFGLLSPVIYGFSFRKSDNKDYKLATLAAASLVCITILSIGKAYVRRLSSKAYIQTIFYYLSVGFMVSGVGYVSGDLINMLLKKLGVFDSSAPVAMPGLEAGFVDGAWSSY